MAALRESRRLPAQRTHIPQGETARETPDEGFPVIRSGSNGVACMLTISHKRLFDETKASGSAGHQSQPIVMHESRGRYGQRKLDQGPIDQRRTSGNRILDQQSRKIHASGIEAGIAPERRMPLTKGFVDDSEIAVHQKGSVDAVAALQVAHHAEQSAQLVQGPHIVLVAQRGVRGLCFAKKAGEVADRSKMVRAAHANDAIRPHTPVVLDERSRIVYRSIVSDEDSERYVLLVQYRFDLGPEIARPIVGGEQDIDAWRIHARPLTARWCNSIWCRSL